MSWISKISPLHLKNSQFFKAIFFVIIFIHLSRKKNNMSQIPENEDQDTKTWYLNLNFIKKSNKNL